MTLPPPAIDAMAPSPKAMPKTHTRHLGSFRSRLTSAITTNSAHARKQRAPSAKDHAVRSLSMASVQKPQASADAGAKKRRKARAPTERRMDASSRDGD